MNELDNNRFSYTNSAKIDCIQLNYYPFNWLLLDFTGLHFIGFLIHLVTFSQMYAWMMFSSPFSYLVIKWILVASVGPRWWNIYQQLDYFKKSWFSEHPQKILQQKADHFCQNL